MSRRGQVWESTSGRAVVNSSRQQLRLPAPTPDVRVVGGTAGVSPRPVWPQRCLGKADESGTDQDRRDVFRNGHSACRKESLCRSCTPGTGMTGPVVVIMRTRSGGPPVSVRAGRVVLGWVDARRPPGRMWTITGEQPEGDDVRGVPWVTNDFGWWLHGNNPHAAAASSRPDPARP